MWKTVVPSSYEEETVSNGFCMSGLFKIADDAVQKYPRVQANVKCKKVFIAVDKSIVFLEDENTMEFRYLSFDVLIDCLAMSQSGEITVCGLSDGSIVGIYIRGIPLFNLSIEEDDVGENNTFVEIYEDIGGSFYFVCTNGAVYRLCNIDEKFLLDSCQESLVENETCIFDETILRNVKLERVTGKLYSSNVVAFSVINQKQVNTQNDSFVFATASHIHFRNLKQNSRIKLPEYCNGIKKIFNMDQFLLFLSNSGFLFEICPHTKTIFSHFGEKVELLIDDVIIMENSEQNIELLILTKPVDNSRLVQIIEFPSMKCIYDIPVPMDTWLVKQPKLAVNMYYLCGDNMNELGLPQEIEMKIISETHPEQRLKKLIHKGHFEEAEVFGKQFNLSLQPIYEAKAKKHLIEIRMLNENATDAIDRKFDLLLDSLRLIESKKFFLAIREVELPNRRTMKNYLTFLLIQLEDEQYNSDVICIKEQLLRLETLNIIDPSECYMDWQKFLHHPNIVNVCTGFFKTEMLNACLIYKRHASSILPFLDSKHIVSLLNAIPASTEPFSIIQWLKHFVPTVLQTNPEVMTYLVDWGIQNTRNLQYGNDWPEIGLEFATNILNIFEEIRFLYTDIRRQYEGNMDKIQTLVNALQDLAVLKTSYNLTLTLDNYIKDSIEDSALYILQRVQLGNLKRLVTNFLYPIFMERGQSPNIAIKKYIEFLVNNQRSISFWLERAVLCVEILHYEEEKLLGAILILKSAPVPWPEAAAPLIKLSNSSHPLAIEIKTEFELLAIKKLKVKYDWPSDARDSNMKLVFRIVKLQLPEMLQDVYDLIKAVPEISSNANFYCCYELVKKGEIEAAIKYLDMFEEKQRVECSEKIFNLFSAILDDSGKWDTSATYLFEFMNLLALRSNKADKQQLIYIQNAQILYKEFDLKVSGLELKNFVFRQDCLKKGIEVIISRLPAENIVNYILKKITQLTMALNIEKIEGIIKICKDLENICLSCALAFFVLEFEENTEGRNELFIDLAKLLIVQHMEFIKRDGYDLPDPMAYPLAYKLLVKSLNDPRTDQFEIMEILKWVQLGNNVYELTSLKTYYMNTNEVEQNVFKMRDFSNGLDFKQKENGREDISVFEHVNQNEETITMPNNPTPVLKCISLGLKLLLIEPRFQDGMLTSIRGFYECIEDECTESVKKEFYKSLEHVFKSKQYSICFMIMQNFLVIQKKHNISIIHENNVTVYLRKILKYTLCERDPNFIDLFVMLLFDTEPEECLEQLANKLRKGQQRINYLLLSEMYYTHVGDLTKAVADKQNRIKYFYYIELCKQDSSLKSKHNMEILSIKQLMAELRNKVLDTGLLEKLSHDFGWNYQEVLISQVITILHLQEPIFDVITDALGKEEIVVKTSAEKIHSQCQPYLNEISSTDKLAVRLLQFVSEINFYFYELYLCVIDILVYIDALPKEMELWTNILLFLKHKMIRKRRHKAGQIEIDWWLKSQKEIGVLPKISKYRFPFKPIVQEPLRNILDDEVEVESCESWFPLIKLHTALQGNTSLTEIIQNQEYFCMSAIKNSITEYKQQSEDSEGDVWHYQPINNAFLQSILRLVKHMSDKSKILFVLYFVTNHAPDGADQVEAAYECYEFALKHEKELCSIKKTGETVLKIRRKYPIFKTQHLLHLYGLIEDKLLQLVENPKELINALYHHEFILKPQKPDINKVAKEIAQLHNLNFQAIQMTLLQKWLAFTTYSNAIDLEETYFEDLNETINPTELLSDEFVLRAHYILSSWDAETAFEFLISHIFNDNGVGNTGKQLQMFECFSKLINESSSSHIELVNQKQYIVLKCVHYLKQIGYNFTVDKFNEYDKLNILKKVWQSHANNEHALEIMAYISLGFEINVPQIWNSLLKQMVRLNMIRELNSLVDLISCKSALAHIDGLVLAWECVLRAPFKSANRTRSDHQELILAKNLFRIQSCPLVGRLNILDFIEDCIRLDRPHMAAVLLVFSKENEKEEIKQKILQRSTGNLKKDIIDLDEMGILPVIVNSVLRELNL